MKQMMVNWKNLFFPSSNGKVVRPCSFRIASDPVRMAIQQKSNIKAEKTFSFNLKQFLSFSSFPCWTIAVSPDQGQRRPHQRQALTLKECRAEKKKKTCCKKSVILTKTDTGATMASLTEGETSPSISRMSGKQFWRGRHLWTIFPHLNSHKFPPSFLCHFAWHQTGSGLNRAQGLSTSFPF